MRIKRYFLLISFFLFAIDQSFSQTTKHKVAIFAPLYLDSAFDDLGNYRYDKQFPKFINPGLEFYEGAQLALDTLTKEGAPLEVFVYDTRSKELLAQQVQQVESNGRQ